MNSEIFSTLYFPCPLCHSTVGRMIQYYGEEPKPQAEEIAIARSMGDLTCPYCKYIGPIGEEEMICKACKKAGFRECNGPHISDQTVKTLLEDVARMSGNEVAADMGPEPVPTPELIKPSADDKRLLTLYGITSGEREAIARIQGYVCAICKRPPVTKALSVDHDHKRCETRGLLCHTCNKAVAYLLDDPERARRLTEYLELYPAMIALGFIPVARAGRSTRKWKTKREKLERKAFVNERLRQLGYKEIK